MGIVVKRCVTYGILNFFYIGRHLHNVSSSYSLFPVGFALSVCRYEDGLWAKTLVQSLTNATWKMFLSVHGAWPGAMTQNDEASKPQCFCTFREPDNRVSESPAESHSVVVELSNI